MNTPDSPGDRPPYEGRYQLGAALGQGPVGVVYRGVDLQTGRPCALKRLHTPGHDRAVISAVKREAAAAWALGHPAIIAAHDSGVDHEGRLYLVSELIEGESLKTRLASESGALSATQALLLLEPVCAALEVAHRAGLSHGGLRPANILTTPAGGTFLTDFGVAHLGLPGGFCESLCYLPPEVYRDEVRGPTPAGDVFALGAVLFECLTGQPLFHATTAAAATFKICQAPLPPPHHFPGLPRGIYDVVAMACARARDERFAEPRSFLRALSAAAKAGVQARVTSLENRLPRPLARGTDDQGVPLARVPTPRPADPYTEPLPAPAPAPPPVRHPEQTTTYILPDGVTDDMLVSDDDDAATDRTSLPAAGPAQPGAPGKPVKPAGSGPQGGHTALYVPIPTGAGPALAAVVFAPVPSAPAKAPRRHEGRVSHSRPRKAPVADLQRRLIWGRVKAQAPGPSASAQTQPTAAPPEPRPASAAIQPVGLEATLQGPPAAGQRTSRVGIATVGPLSTTAAMPTLSVQSDTAPMVPLPPPGAQRFAAHSLILASLVALIVGVGAAWVVLGLHPRSAAPLLTIQAGPQRAASATAIPPPQPPAAGPRPSAPPVPRATQLYDDFGRAVEREDVDTAIALYRDLPADSPYRAQGQARYEALRQRFEQTHLQLAEAAQRGRLCDVVQQQLDQLQSVAEREDAAVKDAQRLLRRCHAPRVGRTRRGPRPPPEVPGDDLAPPLF